MNSPYLTRPEGHERTEGEARLEFAGVHRGDGGAEPGRERAGLARLDLDLGHLERAERDVREDLRARGAGEPDRGPVLGRVLLADEVRVLVLEDLVEPVLEHALEGVADERGPEALPDPVRALLGEERAHAGDHALVLGRVHLHVALGNVDGREARVGRAAGERAAEHALEVIRGIMGDGARKAATHTVSAPRPRRPSHTTPTEHPICRRGRGAPWEVYKELRRGYSKAAGGSVQQWARERAGRTRVRAPPVLCRRRSGRIRPPAPRARDERAIHPWPPPFASSAE
jgi:hypothetical protein